MESFSKWIFYFMALNLMCRSISLESVNEVMDKLANIIEDINNTVIHNHDRIAKMEQGKFTIEPEKLIDKQGPGINECVNASVVQSLSEDMEMFQKTIKEIQNENSQMRNELLRYQEGTKINDSLGFQLYINKTNDVLRGMVQHIFTEQQQQGQQMSNIQTEVDALKTGQQQQGQQMSTIQIEVDALKNESMSINPKWPRGTFGLPMPRLSCVKSATGNSYQQSACPSGTWLTGSRYQDTQNVDPQTSVTPSNQCITDSWSSTGITLKHCLKHEADGYFSRHNWPEGSYCIYKLGACPTGFSSGKIKWDDEDDSNANTVTGYSMDGQFDSDTIREFCCREDGLTTAAIYLPMEKPFYLFAKTEHCQQVHGMNVRADIVKWDDEDSNNGNSRSGSLPYLHGFPLAGTKWTFCYYTKT